MSIYEYQEVSWEGKNHIKKQSENYVEYKKEKSNECEKQMNVILICRLKINVKEFQKQDVTQCLHGRLSHALCLTRNLETVTGWERKRNQRVNNIFPKSNPRTLNNIINDL